MHIGQVHPCHSHRPNVAFDAMQQAVESQLTKVCYHRMEMRKLTPRISGRSDSN